MDILNLISLGFLSLFYLVQTVLSGGTGFYVDTPEQTVLLEKLSKKQQRYIREEMLQILGLEKAPKVRKHKVKAAPQYMIDLYYKYAAESAEDLNKDVNKQHADLIISFTNNAHKMAHLRHEAKHKFYFDFGDVPATDYVERADFRLFKRRSRQKNLGDFYHIQVFSLGRESYKDEIHLQLEFNASIATSYRGWVDLNVTSIASSWTYYPVTNLGLYVKFTDDNGEEVSLHDAGIVGRHGDKEKQPFLVAYFKADKNARSRRKRAASDNKKRKSKSEGTSKASTGYSTNPRNLVPFSIDRQPCQRRTLFVDFQDLKWQEWIIAPKGYSAFYCYGECVFPLNTHMNATNHAIVQELYRNMIQDDMHVPKPCCAPTKLSALSVLYFDDRNNVILKDYQNMVVKACGCQ